MTRAPNFFFFQVIKGASRRGVKTRRVFRSPSPVPFHRSKERSSLVVEATRLRRPSPLFFRFFFWRHRAVRSLFSFLYHSRALSWSLGSRIHQPHAVDFCQVFRVVSRQAPSAQTHSALWKHVRGETRQRRHESVTRELRPSANDRRHRRRQRQRLGDQRHRRAARLATPNAKRVLETLAPRPRLVRGSKGLAAVDRAGRGEQPRAVLAPAVHAPRLERGLERVAPPATYRGAAQKVGASESFRDFQEHVHGETVESRSGGSVVVRVTRSAS